MEETAIIAGNSPWFASVLISFLTISGTVITSLINKKRLSEEITRLNEEITSLNKEIEKFKHEEEARNKEYQQIRDSYFEVVQKLKTLRDFEIAVDGKDIAKLLNKGL